MKAISVNAKSNKATNNLTVFVPSAIRSSVCLLFSYGQEHREQPKLLRAGARLRPLHQRFDVCTRHHRVTLQVFMRRIFFSFSFSRLSLLLPPVLSLSVCLTLSPTLSTTSPFFPCSRFRCALLIAAECDPQSPSPLSLSLSLSISL